MGKTYFSNPVRDGGSLDQDGSNEDDKWSDSGVFRRQSQQNLPHLNFKRNWEIKDELRGCGQNNRKNGVTIKWYGEIFS